ncbi:MAG: antitoxin [Acidimicrobiia bacterium]|nr:antitoxin [Acidimicrobiia bacterium]
MSQRIQIVVSSEERAAFRAQAKREGRSLSEWLREAGRSRLEATSQPGLGTVRALQRFWSASDEREDKREPDWDHHLRVIRRSQVEGLPDTAPTPK